MASSKEIPQSSRPITHRFSVSSGSLPARAHMRNSNSLSSSFNPTHRVTRRKSVATNSAGIAAVAAAAARDIGDDTLAMPAVRRQTISRNGTAKGSLHTPPSSLPSHKHSIAIKHRATRDEDAIIDDEELDDFDDGEISFQKIAQRRASDGSSIRGEGKRSKDDLKCTKCGKGYKHSSCLTKHLWEHTPEWSFTSKLSISKHQQVQLLEAASVLVAMNNGGATPPESTRDSQSDQEYSSPAASGSSDRRNGLSSADTTPPPQELEGVVAVAEVQYGAPSKRYSSGNSFSRSYQSIPNANQTLGESAPSAFAGSSYHQTLSERRPLSSGVTHRGSEDEAGLAAAVELLSCSFGTPHSGPVTMDADVPPVPPLPAQYLGQSAFSGTTLINYPRAGSTSYVRENSYRSRDIDVRMQDIDDHSAADEDESDSRGRSDEDDDGVFGRMDE